MKQRQRITHNKKYGAFKDDSDSGGEETELFSVKNSEDTSENKKRRETPTVDKEIEDGDTLQSLSIRYHCSIEELKRLNNIHRENEIFAKRIIKVPHYPISMALAGVHSGTNTPYSNENIPSTSSDTKDLTETLITLSRESEVNQIIFNTTLKPSSHDIDIIKDSQDNASGDDDDEEIHLLPQLQFIQKPVDPVIVNKLDCSGVDGGISLWALIGFIILLIVIIPLIYVFYVAEHLEKYHHQE